MSSAEDMAKEFEKDGGPDHFGGAKRNKNERVENKREHPEGDTRKIINNAHNGEQKRKEGNKHRWVPGKLLFGARAGYVAGERYFSPLEHGHSQGSLEEGGGGEPAGDCDCCLLMTQDLPQQEVLEATTTG
ncbi:hypothetical protein PRIPAC_92420 [Pristionchus pacificus]|uniref:Uncharacterized protein n=1 Tax=Pristionchus pacificus TaxID=54126 RepID=A0A2A6CI31_PRIPA|nr:hypothetical protein PRIPAC_92420 [Pristionchus pacificus]|eukprot:PDM77750.1 hypothetical protein PRIPAC_34617 [Pristionchus pacificus]